MTALVFIVFFVALFLAFPVAVALGFSTILPGLLDPSFSGNLQFVYRSLFSGLDATTILAIPLFMLSGAIMAKGGLADKLFDVFAIIVGRVKGGMPCAVVVTCLFYGAISGSGTATCAAVGSMCIPILLNLGYEKKFSAALVATSSSLGVIIPPSIPFIAYGLVTGTSISNLFVAGIIPGLLIAACIMVYVQFYCRTKGEDVQKTRASYEALKNRGFVRVFLDGFWALLSPVIILGGIYSGIVTPTEAACVSVFYAIIVCLFIYRTVKVSELIGFFCQAVASFAPLGLMMGLAQAFAKVLVMMKAPNALATFLSTTVDNRIAFLLLLNVVLIIIGMVMDVAPAMMILSPMLLPFAQSLGIDPIHLGVLMVCNLAIGFVTPPFGLNLFISAPMVNVGPMAVGKRAFPFIISFLAALVMITFIPAISLILL